MAGSEDRGENDTDGAEKGIARTTNALIPIASRQDWAAVQTWS